MTTSVQIATSPKTTFQSYAEPGGLPFMTITKNADTPKRNASLATEIPSGTHLPVEEFLVVGDSLLFVHAANRREVSRPLRLKHVNDIAVWPPIQGEIFDQPILRRFHLGSRADEYHDPRRYQESGDFVSPLSTKRSTQSDRDYTQQLMTELDYSTAEATN